MPLKDQAQHYGSVSVFLHWLMALSLIGLFVLGLMMQELSYYDENYRLYPYWHKSLGLLLFGVFWLRVLWRCYNTNPLALAPPDTNALSRLEGLLANVMHASLYVLMFIVFTSGYLISTADGRPIEVFSWFVVPAMGWPAQYGINEDLAGQWHYYSTHGLIILALLHALAALKHHFINKDHTLVRMLGLR